MEFTKLVQEALQYVYIAEPENNKKEKVHIVILIWKVLRLVFSATTQLNWITRSSISVLIR